ncbi:MAG TPA: PEP-CTERM sorting domain-containing protein [Telluria sp.]
MANFKRSLLAACALHLCAALPAGATAVRFTGGDAVYFDGTRDVTNNVDTYYNVTYYAENGYKISNTGGVLNLGNYYGLGNDVMHTHWARNGGGVTEVRVARLDGAAFDLNAFDVSSNNHPGGTASGDELTYIHASVDGVHASYRVLLPPENWGGTMSTVLLGAQFDNIKAFWFTTENFVDCLGIDNLVLEDAGQVPEPGSLALIGLAFAGLAAVRRKTAQAGRCHA